MLSPVVQDSVCACKSVCVCVCARGLLHAVSQGVCHRALVNCESVSTKPAVGKGPKGAGVLQNQCACLCFALSWMQSFTASVASSFHSCPSPSPCD